MNNYKIEYEEVEKLHFDPKNPRLAEFNTDDKMSEDEILRLLWETMAVDELVLSIASSGFFKNEPLLVLEETHKKTKQNIVIEGNRRLAAVKSIRNPSVLDGIPGTNILTRVPPGIVKELKEIPIIKVSSREEAWKYIGFKHINGPAKWGSFAKAQYIAQIHKEFKISLNDIGAQIGDNNKTVQKLYQGLRVIEQAEENKVFNRNNIKGTRLFFSHLYTALGYEGVQSYLGIKDADQEQENPVPIENMNALSDLLLWLFGDKRNDEDPVIKSQNPDLRRLDSILKSSEATRALKDGSSLIISYELSQPTSEIFEINLVAAKQSLQKAHSYLSIGYDGELDPLKIAGSIASLAEDLYNSMETKYKEKTQPSNKKRITE